MPDSPKYAETFINEITKPWEELAPQAVFGDMTLAQFKTKVKASLDARAEIASLESQLTAARQDRSNADPVSVETCITVVNGVRSHPQFGENSPLYKAMGYVPKNERKSGLVRPQSNQENNQDKPSDQAA